MTMMGTKKSGTKKAGAKKAPAISPVKAILEALGEEIYLSRTAQRMTKSEFARQSGVSEVTIHAIENKTAENVGLEVLYKLATALGREIDVTLS